MTKYINNTKAKKLKTRQKINRTETHRKEVIEKAIQSKSQSKTFQLELKRKRIDFIQKRLKYSSHLNTFGLIDFWLFSVGFVYSAA